MGLYYYLIIIFLFYNEIIFCEKLCPENRKLILPCRCSMQYEQLWYRCSHSDLPTVLKGLKEIANFYNNKDTDGFIDNFIIENNYLPSLRGNAFSKLKIVRLMLRYNGLEQVPDNWLNSLESSLLELFIVEPNLRFIPLESLTHLKALKAVTIQTKLMKRFPLISGLSQLSYLHLESFNLEELSAQNFKNNPALEIIRIGQCPMLMELPENLFSNLPKLKLLNISHCGLSQIHPRSFQKLPVLKELILMDNRIADSRIVGRAVHELPQLKILRLDQNFIERLTVDSFLALPSLESLHLSRNRIVEIQRGAFHKIPQFKYLNLNGNSLKSIHPESFFYETGLEELWLEQNQIDHIQVLSTILNTFPKLVYLHMSFNQLNSLPKGYLIRGHRTLEYFDLNSNLLNSIQIENMPVLRELRLRNNSLGKNLNQIFWNLPQLKGLDLSNNSIRKIDRNFLNKLPELRKIDLSFNALEFIDPAAFHTTNLLQNINLSYNSLIQLNELLFHPVQDLFELDVSNNKLQEFLRGLPRGIEHLHLKNNQIKKLPINNNIMMMSADLNLPILKLLDLSGNLIENLPQNCFAALKGLKKLLIARNLLKTLFDGSLTGLKNLEILDASGNRIELLKTGVFQMQNKLLEINLAFNKLEQLPEGIFDTARNLKRLNLTRNLLKEIPSRRFLNTNKNLEMLDLSGNLLKTLQSLETKNLTFLDLSHNQLISLNAQILNGMDQLTTLKLSYNHLEELESDSFKKLTNLIRLDLNNNALKTLNPNSVNTLINLFQINLSRNKLENLPSNVFVNLPNLQIVEFQENQLQSIAKNSFNNVPQILMLNLSHNQFTNLENAGINQLTQLELLDLSYNSIKTLESKSLKQLELLVELRLDNNKICSVQRAPFNSMPRLRVLSLKMNKITQFPASSIEKIRNNLAELDLNGNPLICSCTLLWMKGWLQENYHMGPKCSNSGILVRNMELTKNDCNEEEQINNAAEVVADGCESQLLPTTPSSGLGFPQFPPLFNNYWNNLNGVSEKRNFIAPSPEETDLFSPPLDINEIDAINPQTIHPPTRKDGNYGFSFLTVPLSLLRYFMQGKNAAATIPATTPSINERVAILHKPGPPDEPRVEQGGFTPLPQGTGGFLPIIPNTTTEISPPSSTTTTTTTSSTASFLLNPITAVTTSILSSLENYDNEGEINMNDKRSPNTKKKSFNNTTETLLKFFNATEYVETSTFAVEEEEEEEITTTIIPMEIETTPKFLAHGLRPRIKSGEITKISPPTLTPVKNEDLNSNIVADWYFASSSRNGTTTTKHFFTNTLLLLLLLLLVVKYFYY